MHDVHRDSLLYQGKNKKIKNRGQRHDHEEQRSGDEHAHDHDRHGAHDSGSPEHHEHHEHEHDTDHEQHAHDHHHDPETPHGHQHEHDDAAYEEHEDDLHVHSHDRGTTEDRAFTHVHDHGHNFYHGHFHSHHPEHTTALHKVFGDPARDWFAAGLMGVLIATGYFKLLPGYLSDGMLVCAAIIGIFPLMKNAVFECIGKRTVNADILAGALLLAGLFLGRFTEVALVALFLLIGSFLRLNFSWRND
jgi:cation transport ATPase